ncbi:MAG TPA: IMP dehydrogenase [Candidatus Hydrogenedentes bacterium]|nr:IMP dehydrogenase [Candidatus Hydrogenedentota bacterium]HPG68234.1 IMP dehydrogenase [Candidatus Hydrogenedentota bacterium]
MDREKQITQGLSFDDVLLKPARSCVLPRDADVRTRFSRHIELNIPLVSAAMDTVTEARLAIAIAQEGGIGVVHKNLTIDEQAAEIDRVKRSQAGVISAPITLTPDQPVQAAEDLMGRYHISGVPITDTNGRLVGILTNRDLRFLDDYSVPIESVMTKDNLVTVPPGTTLEQAKGLLHKHRIEKLPIVERDGTLVGLITIKDINKARDFPNRCCDPMGRLRVAAALSVGFGGEEIQRAKALVEAGVDVLVVDSAHGHSEMVLDTVKLVKNTFPDIDVVAGNVVTAEGARDLIEAGADGVKVGVGPGSICTTRVIAGAGMPQVSAILEVAREAALHNVPVIADGGIKYSGDIVKAIAAGADSVMIGGLFAGTAESPGETILYEGRTYKVHRGMGSIKAMQRGSKARYMQFDVDQAAKLVPEGVEGRVPYRGPLADYIHQLVGGLRSGMGYCGSKDIAALKNETSFIRVSAAGLRESHPHDVTITEEPPNYQLLS